MDNRDCKTEGTKKIKITINLHIHHKDFMHFSSLEPSAAREIFLSEPLNMGICPYALLINARSLIFKIRFMGCVLV